MSENKKLSHDKLYETFENRLDFFLNLKIDDKE